jgi:glycosyltransferase involved in cell wall biosynthesis
VRVLHLATDIYGGHGGIALYNRDLIAAMVAHPGIEEIVVLPRIIPGKQGALPPKTRFHHAAARGKVAFAVNLARTLRHSPPFDMVICAHINLLPFTLMTGKPPVLLIYGIEAWQPHWLPSNLGALVTISTITLERFRSWAHVNPKTFLLPNAIDSSLYAIKPKDDALLERYGLRGKRILLTVGRVVASERYKGFDEVIEVLPDLPSDVAYLVAGGGSDLDRLREKVRALGLADRVAFTGLFPDSEKPDLYNLADVYVMPSRGEGFGFVLLEALASGLPVIGSRHDGGREALRDGQLGTLVDPASRAELRRAILDALTRRERHVPEGLSYFAFDRFQTRVFGMIDELLGVRAPEPAL